MADRPLARAELAALAGSLRAMLALVASGEMEASTAMRYRLEGAVGALDAAMGRPSTLLADLPQLST